MKKLFVWRGGDVLKNYSAGMVVVAAETVDDAWAKLRADDISAWNNLRHGNMTGLIESEAEWEMFKDDEDLVDEGWVVPEPEVFELDDLPTLVLRGGS